jgi:hypothetical protein
MALAILPKPTDDTPLQIPLPNPDDLPAWVHAALDRYDTSYATYIGLAALMEASRDKCPEIASVSQRTRRVERMAFHRLRWLAITWQSANYRTFLTSFEMRVMELELEALQKPYAMKLYTHEHIVKEKDGSSYRVTQDDYQHDVEWIAGYIQKQLGAERYVMDIQYIKSTLQTVSNILEVCNALDTPVGYIDNMRQWHQSRIEALPQKRRKLQNRLQRAS